MPNRCIETNSDSHPQAIRGLAQMGPSSPTLPHRVYSVKLGLCEASSIILRCTAVSFGEKLNPTKTGKSREQMSFPHTMS